MWSCRTIYKCFCIFFRKKIAKAIHQEILLFLDSFPRSSGSVTGNTAEISGNPVHTIMWYEIKQIMMRRYGIFMKIRNDGGWMNSMHQSNINRINRTGSHKVNGKICRDRRPRRSENECHMPDCIGDTKRTKNYRNTEYQTVWRTVEDAGPYNYDL